MDRYVDPLVTHLKTMVRFRKFKRGSKAEVDEVLRVEKSEYPTRIVYCFGISYEHPGIFILSYIKTTHVRHEFVGLHPKGFKFRKQMFGKIEHLVAYFQKHIDDLQHESAPMQKSAFGGSSVKTSDWGSNDSGWQSQPKSALDKSTPFPRGENYSLSFCNFFNFIPCIKHTIAWGKLFDRLLCQVSDYYIDLVLNSWINVMLEVFNTIQ